MSIAMSNVAIFSSVMEKKNKQSPVNLYMHKPIFRIAVWQAYLSEWNKYLFIKEKLWMCDSWQ